MATADAIDLGLFGPGSVTWRIHADPSGFVGGLRALLIQALHPLAMAAVDQYSDFRNDAWGRLQRTSEYVMVTTFGTTAEAERAGARVRALHRRISGVDAVTRQPFRADDPELLLWVHAVEVDSFLTAYLQFGPGLALEDRDRYVAEMVRAAELVGLAAEDVPQSVADLGDYLGGMQRLCVTPAARDGLGIILNPPLPLPARLLWPIAATATVSILPPPIRELYGLPWFGPATPAVRVAVFGLCRALNGLFPPPPPVRRALERARTLEPDHEQVSA